MKSHLAPSGHQGLSFAFLFDSQAQGTAQLRITTTGEISFEGRQLGAALMLAPGYKKGRSSACEAFGNPTHVASAEVFAVRAVRLALPQVAYARQIGCEHQRFFLVRCPPVPEMGRSRSKSGGWSLGNGSRRNKCSSPPRTNSDH
jgi:hypothetical protein